MCLLAGTTAADWGHELGKKKPQEHYKLLRRAEDVQMSSLLPLPLERSQNQIQTGILEKLENLLSISWVWPEAKSAAYPFPLNSVLNFGQVSETVTRKILRQRPHFAHVSAR